MEKLNRKLSQSKFWQVFIGGSKEDKSIWRSGIFLDLHIQTDTQYPRYKHQSLAIILFVENEEFVKRKNV